MIGWMFLIAYLIGYVLSVRPLAEESLQAILDRAERDREKDQRAFPNTWRQYHPEGELVATRYARRDAMWVGLLKATVWPAIMPVSVLSRRLTTPAERQKAADRERAQLKAWAEENGLNFPGDDQ